MVHLSRWQELLIGEQSLPCKKTRRWVAPLTFYQGNRWRLGLPMTQKREDKPGEVVFYPPLTFTHAHKCTYVVRLRRCSKKRSLAPGAGYFKG